jgi:hypothetical protein
LDLHYHVFIEKMVEPDYTELLKKYPFLTYLVYGGNEYIGVIQNLDEVITTIYDYGALKTLDQKQQFLELAEMWWWESNRLIPINVFLKQEWTPFRSVVKTMNSKDVEIKFGPQVSLKEIAAKRSKRRSITLVRKVG